MNTQTIDTERKKSKSATHRQRGLLSELGYAVEEGAALTIAQASELIERLMQERKAQIEALIEAARRRSENINLIELAARYTELHRESVKEMSGPCPKCGGDDRFHVQEQRFMCRKCHDEWGDPIEFVRWREGCTPLEACSRILDGAMPTPATVRQPEKRQPEKEWDAERAAKEMATYQAALWDDVNTTAHTYLEQRRGLDPHTWLLFGLGYRHDTPLPNTWDATTRTHSHPPQPAIAIPWYHKQTLVAIRYRFLQNHFYVDAAGKERRGKDDKGVKQTGRGTTAGHIFGGHAIRRYGMGAPEARTLIITEGELNAMSLFQIARDTGLDVLSPGSESNKLPQETITYAQRYRRVMVWADRAAIVDQLQAAIPNAFAVTSEMCGGKDANDLLRFGHLGGYLSAWRFQMCETPADRAALYADLQRAANTLTGLDAGSLAVMGAIAA